MSKRTIKNKCAAQLNRDTKKRKLEQDLDFYNFLNDIMRVYPKTSFLPTDFAKETDPKLEGDRKNKNKIAAHNSRIRTKRRDDELEKRIRNLVEVSEPQYMPVDLFFKPLHELWEIIDE